MLQQIQPLHLLMLAALHLVQCVTSAMGPVSAMSLLFPVTHWHSRHASPFPDTLGFLVNSETRHTEGANNQISEKLGS